MMRKFKALVGPPVVWFCFKFLFLQGGSEFAASKGASRVSQVAECLGPAAGYACHRVGPQPFMCLVQEKVDWAESPPPIPHLLSSFLLGSSLCVAKPHGGGSLPCRWTARSPQPGSPAGHQLQPEKGGNNNSAHLFCKALSLGLFLCASHFNFMRLNTIFISINLQETTTP